MRQKRAKTYRRLLHQYVLYFKFREPFQVLVDNTFAESLIQFRVQEPLKQLRNALHADKVKPMITQCCMVALYNAEKAAKKEGEQAHAQAKQVVALAKEWERRKCNHKEALSPAECLYQVIGSENKHRYILAANDVLIRRMERRTVPGLPIVHYAQSVLVLEPMSDVTLRHIDYLDATKSAVSETERKLLDKSKPQIESTSAPKRKRTKGPNPLSVKKPKKAAHTPPMQVASTAPPTAQQTKRRRKKRGSGKEAES
ncbi:hypothetical protein MVES1_001095 [Malassezia vespertilionis]|uniref:U three protein 23 n=1 Tax=Malassezia vespertilionis TaxID=2020962 RepID=A0A2N1JF20_9BASI|nr:uncharacterized protein MVES1_001095 [Malassezia vespertilionis]PKI85130.1 hypothetical protein MVES_001030 [Malassezia vespertilionis]WFD05762.1 hypothetical protein MVES1_001095 [Malassezia vespertilionis]